MEFKLTAGEVLQAEAAIAELSRIKMKAAVGIPVARLSKAITRQADEFRKKRLDLVKNHGDKQDNGKYKVKEGHELDLDKDGKALLDDEVSVRSNPIPRGISDIEIEPKFVDVIIRRFRKLSGQEAVLSTGATFSSVAETRGKA